MIYQLITGAGGSSTPAPTDLGYASSSVMGLEVRVSGSPTFSLALNGSDDGQAYFDLLGTDITAAGLYRVAGTSTPAPPVRFIQPVLTYTGGTGTVSVVLNEIPFE